MIKLNVIIFSIFISCLGCAETNSADKDTEYYDLSSIQIAQLDSSGKLQVQTSLDEKPFPLTLVGQALRTFWGLKVYTIQLFVSDPDQFDTNQSLTSLDKLKAVAVYIKAIRSVEGDRMQKSMREALENNKVDIQKESIKHLLESLNVTSDKGDIFSFIGKRQDDGTETLEFQFSKQSEPLIISEPGIIRDIFSIWLGDTSHSKGLTKLKKQLLSSK